MFIISLPWKHRELEYLQAKSYLFDLCMEYSPKQSYLVIQNNKVALIGMGTVEGEFSCQIRSRAFTMNGSIEKIINSTFPPVNQADLLDSSSNLT